MKLTLTYILVPLLCSIIIACGGSNANPDGEIIDPSPVNQAPSSNAGDDQEVNELDTVNLIGSGSDTDGNISGYLWTQSSGVSVEITTADAQNASFEAPNINEDLILQFQLEVTDDDGATATDVIEITILNIEEPITLFNVGGDLNDVEGQLTITLNNQSTLTLTEVGPYIFELQLAEGDSYEVSIENQPIGQQCALTNQSGVIDGDVTNILIKCSDVAVQECNDGIDNDEDGLVDWQFDLGCTDNLDNSEGGLKTGEIDNGWTVVEPADDTIIYYVSDSKGNDTDNGITPETAFKTFAMAYAQTSDNRSDWILLKRGDTFFETLTLRYGRSLLEPYVVSSYGESTVRPLFKTGDANAIESVSSFQLLGSTFMLTHATLIPLSLLIMTVAERLIYTVI